MYLFVDPISGLLGSWSEELTIWSIILRVVLSVLASAVIGCERSSKRHAAGLRTFIVVSVSTTFAGIIDAFIGLPILTAACIIGVAVMSVNAVIYSSKSKIKGLTTSVGLWACSVLGATFGFGLYTVGIIFCMIFTLSLALFPQFEGYLKNKSNHFEVHLELTDSHNLDKFVTTIRELGLIIDDIEVNSAYFNSGLSVYSISITITSQELKKYKSHKEIIEALKTLEYVHYIEEMR